MNALLAHKHPVGEMLIEQNKLNLSWLKQLLTLAAGGLAILFAFVGNRPLTMSVTCLAGLIGGLWVVTILSALVAFRSQIQCIAQLMSLQAGYSRLLQVQEEFETLLAKPAPDLASANALNRLKTEFEAIKKNAKIEKIGPEVSKSYSVAARAAAVSLYTFALGVIFLYGSFLLRLFWSAPS